MTLHLVGENTTNEDGPKAAPRQTVLVMPAEAIDAQLLIGQQVGIGAVMFQVMAIQLSVDNPTHFAIVAQEITK